MTVETFDTARTVGRGEVVRSIFSLSKSRLPVTDVAVVLGGLSLPGRVHGDDLRSLASLEFRAPMTVGNFRWAVSGMTALGCESGKSNTILLTVQ